MKRDKMYILIIFICSLFVASVQPPHYLKGQTAVKSVTDTPTIASIKEVSLKDSMVIEYDKTLKSAKEISNQGEILQKDAIKKVRETGNLLNKYTNMDKKECIVYVKDTTIVVSSRNRSFWERVKTLNFKKTSKQYKDTVIRIKK